MVGEELREEKGQFMNYFLGKGKVLVFIPNIIGSHWGSFPSGSVVKNPHIMQETQVQFLG